MSTPRIPFFLSALWLLTLGPAVSQGLAQFVATHSFNARQGHNYLYQSPGDTRIFRVWLPAEDWAVRGIIIGGLDSSLEAFAVRHHMGLASIAGGGGQAYTQHAPVFMQALVDFAALGIHPELAHVPFISLGNSTGGGWAYGVAMLRPERAICFMSNVMVAPNPANPPAAGLGVPGIFTVGETDRLVQADVTTANLFGLARPAGAVWGRMVIQGMGHEARRVWRLGYPFFEDMIARRLPADWDPREGPAQLRPIDPQAEGWIADDTTWYAGLTAIYPVSGFSGVLDGSTSWYPSEDIAVLARSYSSWEQPGYLHILGIADHPPADQGVDTVMDHFRAGETITLSYDPGGTAWERVEFYRGAALIGEVSSGEPVLQHVLQGDRIAQSFSVLHHAPDGTVYTAPLQGILVLPPLDKWHNINRFGWFYDGFEPWLYHAAMGWIWMQNYEHITRPEPDAGFFFYHAGRESWNWSRLRWLPWVFDFGTEGGWFRESFTP